MSLPKKTNKIDSTKPNVPKSVPKKESNKTEQIQKVPSDEHANVTIRLSDLGIFKRTPLEVELKIQSGRISKVFEKTIEKLKIVLCLPYYLKYDACLLRKNLQPADVNYIVNVCLKYTRPNHINVLKESVSFQAMATIVDRISCVESAKRKESESQNSKGMADGRNGDLLIDPQMALVIEILWKSHELKQLAFASFKKIDKQSIKLVESVEHLQKIMEKKLAVKAAEQRADEQYLNKAWNGISAAKANIEKVKKQLEKQRQELGNQVTVKKRIAENYKIRIQELREQVQDDIKKNIADSELGMRKNSNASCLNQAKLLAESKNATQQYESLLTKHLAFEKGLRAKRFKVETQLCNWLNKYDADIGEKQAEYDQIKGEYDDEKARMDALQEKFDDQEDEYIVCMEEKDVEEQEIFEEKAYVFLLNRSARKVQRYYKLYKRIKLEKRKAKQAAKKARKGKKGGKK